ncbi:MAG: HEAT repeat domain-containing protein [Fibrobacterota bacterium]
MGFLLLLAFPVLAGTSFDKLRVGVWVPQPGNSTERALTRTLRDFGIPYKAACRMAELADCPCVVASGPLQEALLDKDDVRALYEYAQEGGRVFLSGEIGKSLFALAGVLWVEPSRRRYNMTLNPNARDPILRYVDRPEERTLRFGNPKLYTEVAFTFAAGEPRGEVLGEFDNNGAAFLRNDYGLGTVYYLGINWDAAILGPQVGQTFEAPVCWINGFEPTTDMFMLFLKAFQEAYVSPALSVPFSPAPYRTTLLLSHDVDTRESFPNSVAFARLEQRYGFTSTFFFTTKFFSDSIDTAYFNPKTIASIRQVHDMGFPIGSHSVSHFKDFYESPIGPELASDADYRPWEGVTLWGESRVSRNLLNALGFGVRSFRSGYLAYNPHLDSILELCGYSINSSVSANAIMCNFPFRGLRSRNLGAGESRVLDIPMTFDGDAPHDPLLPSNMDDRITRWTRVISANADNGAINTFMIHPTNTGYKLAAVEKLLLAVRKRDIWVGDLDTYATFYEKRADIRVRDAALSYRTLRLWLNVPSDSIPAGYSLSVLPSPGLRRIDVRDHRDRRVTFMQRKEGPALRLYSLGLDEKYYEYQRRLIAIIGALFCGIILFLGIFLFVQRWLERTGALRTASPAHTQAVLAALNSDTKMAQKARKVKKLGRLPLTRDILLSQMEFLKGSEAEETAFVYKSLKLYTRDLRALRSFRWWRRAGAAHNLGHLKMAEAERGLTPLLRDRQVEVRLAAVFALGRIEATRALPAILDAVLKSDPWTGRMMIQHLLPMKREAAEAFRGLLLDGTLPAPFLSAAAAAAGTLRDLDAVPLLTNLLDRTEKALRLSVIEALGKIGDDTVLDRLAQLFAETDCDIRLAALSALARLANPAAVPVILRLLGSNGGDTMRLPVLRSLLRFGSDGLDRLIALLEHGNPELSALSLQVIEEGGAFERLARDLADGTPADRARAERFFYLIVKQGRTRRLEDLSRTETFQHLAACLPVPAGAGGH